ncbi:MAG: alpha-L-rhamnosidase N-terminal domain-containing protein, partial [Candidatus Glassbacteria bacterium]|nr:alpha-L-rhamnosidase N-terminal domain-containing protein [Candidatus Glassbacteria bacterium]
MQKWTLFLVVAVLALSSACSRAKGPEMKVTSLRCEYLENPLGIDETRPRLSWVLESPERGQYQSAYRILVASSPETLAGDQGDLWDTGKVYGDQTTQVVYEGKPLTSRLRCCWKVCAWDKNGKLSAFSDPASWSMGLLSAGEWQGKWIGMKAAEIETPADSERLPPGPPAPCLRKAFTLTKPIARATAYVTARGLFVLHLNGRRVSGDVFVPDWTDYHKRIQYCTYDVTGLLAQGQNVVGALVGDGWYSGYLAWTKKRAHYGEQNSLLLNLVVEYRDGSQEVIASDETWRCHESPMVSSDLLMGEDYDARRELPGWDKAGFDDSQWQEVITVDKPEAVLVARCSQPVQVAGHIDPVSVSEPLAGVYVFDLGQNI